VAGPTPVATAGDPIDTLGVGDDFGVGDDVAVSNPMVGSSPAGVISPSSGSGGTGGRFVRDGTPPGSAEHKAARSRLADDSSVAALNRVRIRLSRTPSLAIQSTSRSLFRSQTVPQRVSTSLVVGSRRGTPEWCKPTSSQKSLNTGAPEDPGSV